MRHNTLTRVEMRRPVVAKNVMGKLLYKKHTHTPKGKPELGKRCHRSRKAKPPRETPHTSHRKPKCGTTLEEGNKPKQMGTVKVKNLQRNGMATDREPRAKHPETTMKGPQPEHTDQFPMQHSPTGQNNALGETQPKSHWPPTKITVLGWQATSQASETGRSSRPGRGKTNQTKLSTHMQLWAQQMEANHRKKLLSNPRTGIPKLRQHKQQTQKQGPPQRKTKLPGCYRTSKKCQKHRQEPSRTTWGPNKSRLNQHGYKIVKSGCRNAPSTGRPRRPKPAPGPRTRMPQPRTRPVRRTWERTDRRDDSHPRRQKGQKEAFRSTAQTTQKEDPKRTPTGTAKMETDTSAKGS